MEQGQKLLMIDSFEIQGIWFLPGKDFEKDGVKGTLKYSHQSIQLDLLDTFENDFFPGKLKHDSTPLIYGLSSRGEWLSLYDCYKSNSRLNASGFDTESYIVNKFYVGTQLIEDEKQAQFTDCSFSFTYLDAWLNINIMERTAEKESYKSSITIDPSKAKEQKKTLTIETENISFSEEIYWLISFPKNYFQSETTELKFNRFYYFSHIDKSHFNFSFCFENINKLRHLLVMLIGSPLYFTYIDFHLPIVQKTSFDGTVTNEKQKCRLFYNQVGDIRNDQRITRHRPGAILIYQSDLLDSIETVFCNWFEKTKLLSEIVNPYISDMYLVRYMNSKFLNTVRSLETYHRFFIERKGLPSQFIDPSLEQEKKALLEFVDQHICVENKQHFIKRINYEDENSFRKRLKSVLDSTPNELLLRLFGNISSKEKNKIITSIVDTRNYFTHRDSKSKYPFALEGHELLMVTKKIDILLNYHILVLLGIPSETVLKRLYEFSKFRSSFT